jgi:hypothetical protein
MRPFLYRNAKKIDPVFRGAQAVSSRGCSLPHHSSWLLNMQRHTQYCHARIKSRQCSVHQRTLQQELLSTCSFNVPLLAPAAVVPQVINLDVSNRLAKLVERHGPAAAESVTTVVRAEAQAWRESDNCSQTYCQPEHVGSQYPMSTCCKHCRGCS